MSPLTESIISMQNPSNGKHAPIMRKSNAAPQTKILERAPDSKF